jgi:transcriptional pleiotropic regulator of transition state genes
MKIGCLKSIVMQFKNKEGEFIVKSTGIVRKVDELGRVVIPIELRRTLEIDVKDSLEIYVDNDRIILESINHPLSVYFVDQLTQPWITKENQFVWNV